MGKSVDLRKDPKHAERLAQVTSTAKKPQPPPPAHQLPPGVTGRPPFPAGKVVGGIAPSSLTDQERTTLESVGWNPDIPIPNNMAELLEEVQAERQAEMSHMPPPIDPRTPKLNVPIVGIEQLPAAEQERVRQRMREAAKQQESAVAAQAATQQRNLRASAIPGLADAMKLADRASAAFTATPEEQAEAIDTTPGPTLAATVEAPAATTTPTTSETGADPGTHICEHCGWDRRVKDVEEPPYRDKMAFLHAMLGLQTFSKDYMLFGGQLTVVFRTLTTKEVEAVYAQAFKERQSGRFGDNQLDFWELINRYRLFLQLLSVRSGATGLVELPEGLSKETNPSAQSFWECDADEDRIAKIEEYITDNVLKTEAVFRVVNNACNQFNRLVAKMEAMADNSDFWSPTEVPS